MDNNNTMPDKNGVNNETLNKDTALSGNELVINEDNLDWQNSEQPQNSEQQQQPDKDNDDSGYVPQYQYAQYSFGYNSYNEPIERPPQYYEKAAVSKTSNRIGLALCIFYAISIAIQFIFVITFRFLVSSGAINSDTANNLVSDTVFNLAFNFVLTFLGFGIAALIIIKGEKRKLADIISFDKPKKGLVLPMLLAGIGYCFLANIFVSLFQSALSPFFEVKMPEMDNAPGILGFAAEVLMTAAAPAIIEEFLFRGAIMGSLKKFGKPFAIFTSALLFGFVHGNLIQIPFAFMVGLFLGFAVMETGSIWVGVLIHFTNNLISVIIGYATNGMGDASINIVNLMIFAVLIVVGIFGFYAISVKDKNAFVFEKTPHVSTSGQRFKWLISRPGIIVYMCLIVGEIIINQMS